MLNLQVCPQKQKVQFVSEKWQQGIGQICLSCKSKLVPEQCRSLCKCYLFCHQSCFLKQYSPYIKENRQIKCISCHYLIEFTFTQKVEWTCTKNPLFILLIAMAVLGWTIMAVLGLNGLYRFILPDTAVYCLLLIFLAILIITIIYSFRHKYLQLQNVKCKDTKIHETASMENLAHFQNMKQQQIELQKTIDNKLVSKQETMNMN